MKRIPRFTKRTWVLTAIVAAIAAMASIGAYAYWTVGGSGSGTATVGDDTDNLVITATFADTLYPAGDSDVTVNIDNPNSYSVHVNDVSLVSFEAFEADGTTPDPDCLVADFHFNGDGVAGSNADLAVNDTIAAGDDEDYLGATVSMDDTAVSQDECKNNKIKVNLSSN
jgi:hypothetical protein